MTKLVFVTNFCPHYRIRLFEKIAQHYETDFLFYSEGKEWYWQMAHGVNQGVFHYTYLKGFWLGRTRVTLDLIFQLFAGKYDVVIKCINGKFALPISFLIAKIRNKPFILYTGIWTRLQTPVQKVIFPITRYLYQNSDAIVVYGAHVKRYLIHEGIDPKKIFIAPHAVDNAAYQKPSSVDHQKSIREKLNIHSRQKVILFLGRLEKNKGIYYLLDAFLMINDKNAVLVLGGIGSELAEIRSKAVSLGIQDRLRFIGYIPVNETVNYYDQADIFVLPSISMPDGKEPWGLTINEVFNRGLPVVVSNAVGAAAGGLVEDGVNGLIVPEKDVQSLAHAMQLLLDDETKRKQFGHNARLKMEQWTIEEMAQGFFSAIEYVIQDR
jgi:glycosyltransferase involved in cell wall biosynthesis